MISKPDSEFISLPEDDSQNLSASVKKYFYHWPLFVIGVLSLFFLCFIYLRYSRPVYQVTTTLLVKDNKSGGATTDVLKGLDIFDGSSKVVENEIEILRSKELMRRVVDRLSLDVIYETEGRVVKKDVYKSRAINFAPVDISSKFFNKKFKVSFKDRNQYVLEEEDGDLTVSGPMNQIHRTKLGYYKLEVLKGREIPKDYECFITIKDPRVVADQILSNLSITVSSKLSTVLILGLESTVPARGMDVLNTLVDVYNEASVFEKNRTTASTLKFIDERLALITGELNEVEKQVEGFKSGQGLTNISSEAELYLSNVQTNDNRLNEVNIRLGVVEDIKRFINSDKAGEKLPSTMGIEDPVLLTQINKLSDLQLKRDQLLATTQENNPLVSPIISQIETTRASIRSGIDNIQSILLSTKKNLESNNSVFESSIRKIPGQERQFISIKRQQGIKESLYLFLLQKKEEMALSYASSIADTRVVDKAYTSKNPIKPQKPIFYLGALILGLILPAGFIFGRDVLNNKVESDSDVVALTRVPVSGKISQQDDAGPIVVNETSRTAISEQFRALRTNMQYIHTKSSSNARVTLFTSSVSGEGKSFVASNLAMTLALSGRKVVLLELDLRKPKISKNFGIGNRVGLSNFFVGAATIQEIIRSSDIHENLDIISSGVIPPNPSELLLRDEVNTLMNYLKERYDDILIDTPPIGLVTDAEILSRVVDASFFVVRANYTLKQHVKHIEEIKRKAILPKLNIIINGLPSELSYGYGYYSDDAANTHNFKSLSKELLKRF